MTYCNGHEGNCNCDGSCLGFDREPHFMGYAKTHSTGRTGGRDLLLAVLVGALGLGMVVWNTWDDAARDAADACAMGWELCQ